MKKTIELKELTQDKTFYVSLNGKKLLFSTNRVTVNGKTASRASWYVDEIEILTIVSEINGAWRILRDGRRGYYFAPVHQSPHRWEVILR